MLQLSEFIETLSNPEKGISVTILRKKRENFEENREILMSIIKCLEFCGRQGISFKGERENNTTSSFNNGLFQKKSKQEGRDVCVYVCVCGGGGRGGEGENMEFPVVLKK